MSKNKLQDTIISINPYQKNKNTLFSDNNIIVGKRGDDYLALGDGVSLAVTGEPGTGKTIGVVTPVLLSYACTTFVHDAYGVLYKETAKYRETCGHNIFHILLDAPEFEHLSEIEVIDYFMNKLKREEFNNHDFSRPATVYFEISSRKYGEKLNIELFSYCKKLAAEKMNKNSECLFIIDNTTRLSLKLLKEIKDPSFYKKITTDNKKQRVLMTYYPTDIDS